MSERGLAMARSSPEGLCLRGVQGAGSLQACWQLEFSCSFGWVLNANNCSTQLSLRPSAEKCHPGAIRRRDGFRGEVANAPDPVLAALCTTGTRSLVCPPGPWRTFRVTRSRSRVWSHVLYSGRCLEFRCRSTRGDPCNVIVWTVRSLFKWVAAH